MADEECNTCLFDVVTGVAKNLCDLSNDESIISRCDKLATKVINKKISVEKYLSKLRVLLKDDKDSVFTIDSLITMYKEDKK